MATVGILYLIASVALYLFQRNFLYLPTPGYAPPQANAVPNHFQEFPIKTSDNLDLKSWYVPASSKPLTLVFFHGNHDCLQNLVALALPFIDAGYGFLLVEYRGFGGMPGKPTEQGIYEDARTNIRTLIHSGVPIEKMVLFGHSLGTGVATQMATEFHTAGLILAAPFLSIVHMAGVRFPFFPVSLLTLDKYESLKRIQSISMPVLIANGDKDLVVPPAQGQKLFELAVEPKIFVFVPGAGHNDLMERVQFLEPTLRWLKERTDPLSNQIATSPPKAL